MPLDKETTDEFYISFVPRRLKFIGMGKHLIIIEETTNYFLQIDYIGMLRSVPCYGIPHFY